MRVISKVLLPLVRKAYEIVVPKHGEGKAIMVLGAWVGIGKNYDNEDVAVFYTVRENFDIDFAEKALSVFVGESKYAGELPVSLVLIADSPVNQWKKERATLTKAIKDMLEKEGVPEEKALLDAMYYAAAFGEIRKGTTYGHVHFEDICEIVETALRNCDSVTLKVFKEGDPIDWDGHVSISVTDTKKPGKRIE